MPGIPPGCGDGMVKDGEVCDDGNNSDGDICTKDCQCGMVGDIPNVIAIHDVANGHCYAWFLDPKKFSESQDNCISRGMFLASLVNQSEVDALASSINQSTWIGGNREFLSTKWKWVSGEPWLISPCDTSNASCDNSINLWADGEPSYDPGEQCIEIKGNPLQFNDKECNTEFPYLCELKNP